MNYQDLIARYAPQAVSASQWVKKHGDFDADTQMIVGWSDPDSFAAWAMATVLYGADIEAFHVENQPGFASVEYLMKDGTARNILEFYNKLPKKITRKVFEARVAKHPALTDLWNMRLSA